MSEAPSLHDQFEGLMGFIDDLCRKEHKLVLTHAGDQEAPACEMLIGRAKYEAWEDPAAMPEGLPMGKIALNYKGDPLENANLCPYCDGFVWIATSTPVGTLCECWQCHGKFGRTL
jgi:hypothetical protein